MAKRIVLAFLWLISILGTAGLTAYVMNSPAWVWDTNSWVRRIKHWPEPVVALVGDMPIYQSDIRDIFDSLPPQSQDADRNSKASASLLNIAIYHYLWRDAALSYGIFQSTYPFVHLEHDKDAILQTWAREKLLSQDANPTESQIQSYIAQNPSLFTKRIIHYREDRYSSPTTGKLPRTRLIRTRHGSFSYPGTLNPSSLSLIVNLLPGQSTAIVPCDTQVCRYTKEGKDEVKPAFTADRAKVNAKLQIMGKKEMEWLSTYLKLHPVKIKRQDLINNILH
jgi:hypothetical protein